MGAVLDLERFDDDGSGGNAISVPPATYEDGYTAGHQDALKEQLELQDQLRKTLVQSLSDSVFGYQEAQAHFMTGMATYIEAVLGTVLPETLNLALHARLRAILIDGVEREANRPVTLRVPRQQLVPIGRIIADLGMTHVTLSCHDDLSEHAAFFVSESEELSLDLDAALIAIRDHSEILLQNSQEVS